MKSTKILCTALAMTAVALSCTQEAEAPESLNGGNEVEFTASWAQEDESRTVLQENGTDIWWSAKEDINVFFGVESSGKFTSTNTEPQEVATFRGTLNTIIGSIESYDAAPAYWAIYPYDEDNTCDGQIVTLKVHDEQSGVAGTFADHFFPAVATGESFRLAFYNVCGGARFSVVTEGVQRVVFRSNDCSPMAGIVKVAFGEDNRPEILEVSDARDSVVVLAPEGGFVPGSHYFASMIPQTHKQGLTVTLYTGTKRAVKTNNKSITVRRSAFGTLDNMDEGITDWTDYKPEAEGGGTRSGLYLGIICFNDQLYQMPIKRLNAASYSRFTEFIDGLTTRNATLLYYSVGESLEALSRARYPENLFNVSLLTFTDGLDQGSSMMIEDYPGDDEYLQILNDKLTTTVVQGIPLTAYSVGLKGSDVSDVTKFRNNLKKLATPESNAFEVSDMSTVNSRFQEIADQVNQTLTSYQYNLSLTIPGQANGTRMRFTLDNVSSATVSQLYIEGVFNLSSKSLTEISYHGLTAENGDTVKGEVNGVYVRFPFTGVVIGDGKNDALNKTCIRHWTYVASSGSWQRNSEFDAENDASVEVTKSQKSAVVLLNLDCSTSLSSSFSTLKTHAKSFVQRLYESSIDPADVTGVILNRTSVKLFEGKSATLTATVTPSTSFDKSVTWTSSDPSVATVSTDGVVEAISAGICKIEVTTTDGSFTASCTVTVAEAPILEAVDLGLSVKWASFNVGASAPEDYGDYFAWGETEPEDNYDWSTYKWCMNGSSSQLTKYCHDSSYGYNGFTDNKYTIEAEDDAATVNWGGGWRMPTRSEYQELYNYCSATWATINGIHGKKFISRKSGYSNKWIFLPAAGRRDGTHRYSVGFNGFYWCSSIDAGDPGNACIMYFSSDYVYWNYYYGRYLGQSIRPVYGDFVHITDVSVSPENAALYIGKTLQLAATISPSNASDKRLTWSSSDKSVAKVNTNGYVTGVSAGTAMITATTVDGGFEASCMVFVPNPEAIDLGLSVKWASFNLGATKPEEYGDYFAWGETEPKEEYSWSTYKWCKGSDDTMTKYCNNSRYGYNGFIDYKTVLDHEDDAATANLGGRWRIPTKAEQDELRDNCTWEWTTLNGVNGRKVTSKKEGYTNNWIFLPATGGGVSFFNAGSLGSYWSSSLHTDYPYDAVGVYFSSVSVYSSGYFRYNGLSVRPVCDK